MIGDSSAGSLSLLPQLLIYPIVPLYRCGRADVCTLLYDPTPCPSFCCSAIPALPSGAPSLAPVGLLKVTRGEAGPQPLAGTPRVTKTWVGFHLPLSLPRAT